MFSSLQLANRLRENGHEITFVAPSDTARWIEHCGFAFVDCPHPKTGYQTAYDAPVNGGFRSPRLWSKRVRSGMEKAKAEGFAKTLDALKPDAVLLDCEHHAAIIQTIGKNYPLGLLSFMYLTPPSGQKPPLSSAVIPGRGWRGSQSATWVNWVRLWAQSMHRRLRNAWSYWGANSATVHRALARELGVNLRGITTTRAFQMPWSYRLPTLFLLAADLDFTGTLWPGQAFAGPMVLRDRPSGDISTACDEFLTATAERKIYASFGTMRRPPLRFLKNLVDVARCNENWQFLLASSMHQSLENQNLPPNFTAVPWVDQIKMLEAADCALFHGGAGTLNECVVTRTPMIVYPNGLDGGGNGARVEFHGVGTLAAFSDNSKKIEADLNALFSDPSTRTALDTIADAQRDFVDTPEVFLSGLFQQGR